MKVTIVETGVQETKTGSYEYIKCLAYVQKYGKISMELIVIKVKNHRDFKLGETTVDVLLPHSDFPYSIA